MSLKLALSILLVCLSFPATAKEISSPCLDQKTLCADLPQALKDKPNIVPLKYERTIDGDTFVAGGRIIRVWGIDAPEKGDAAYRVSTWLLQSLVKDKILNCRFITFDKYKRSVMQCKSDDLDIGATMVKFGMARDYKKYSAGYYQPEEKEAKELKRGIWKNNINKRAID